MVSISKHSLHNERLVKFFMEKAYPGRIPTIEELISDNVISGTQLSEIAVSKNSGIPMDPVGFGRDLTDGSDVKTGVVMEDVGRKNHYLSIRHLQKKSGNLRIIGWNPFFEMWHYFIIPSPDQKNLKITFCKKGGVPVGKYSKYEIKSWEEFCSR